MKIKRMMFVLLALVAVSLVFALTASAETVKGTGTITAQGSGMAIVHGDGEVVIHGHGGGSVYVKGADVLQAVGIGMRSDLPGGGVLFLGWRGTIRAAGDDLAVWMMGKSVEFTATGTGWVYLQGRGTYTINGEDGEWTARGEHLPLAPQ